MSEWQSQLEKYIGFLEDTKKGEAKLRFQRSFIRVSDIATQYFCERKVEMAYTHGNIETEAKILGVKGHDRLVQDSVKIKIHDLWKEIYGKRPVLIQEMLILAKFKRAILVGRPDSVLFENGIPNIIFEYKFTKATRPFRNQSVQAHTYGVILRRMGFNTKNLELALVLASPKSKNDKELNMKVYKSIVNKGLKETSILSEDFRVYVEKFDSRRAESDIDWAIKFWMGERDALKNASPNKCKNCEYNKLCQIKKN